MPHITSQFTWGNVSTCEICKTKSCKSRLAVITQRQKHKQIWSPANTKKEFLRSSFALLLLLLLDVCCFVFVLLCLFGCLSVVLLLLLLLLCLRTHLSSIVIPSFRLSANWSADERRRKDRLGYLLSIARWPTGWYHRCVAAPCAAVRNFGTLKLFHCFFFWRGRRRFSVAQSVLRGQRNHVHVVVRCVLTIYICWIFNQRPKASRLPN